MNSEQDKLNELQRVLALKRHEQPPTQFFHNLSDNVLQRLQSPEPPPEPTWRQKLGLDFDSKPVLVCATGVGVCGLLLLGLIGAQHAEPPAGGAIPDPAAAQLLLAPVSYPNPAGAASQQLAPGENRDVQRRSVDPVIVGGSSPANSLPAPAHGENSSTPSSGQQK
jgi:hypothetical protein